MAHRTLAMALPAFLASFRRADQYESFICQDDQQVGIENRKPVGASESGHLLALTTSAESNAWQAAERMHFRARDAQSNQRVCAREFFASPSSFAESFL